MLTKYQQEIRRNGLGGSDIPAICGISPFKTPLDIYLDKVSGVVEEDSSNNATRFGNLFEDVIRKEYEKDHGVKVIKPDADNPKFHPKYNFAFANIDGIINNKNVLEIKTTNQFNGKLFGEEKTDEVPNHYLYQVAWYRVIYDADFCDIAVLIGGQDLRYYRYEPNKELEQNIFDVAYQFWHNNVLAKNPPEPSDCNDILKLHPNHNEKELFIDEDLKLLLSDYKNLKNRKKLLENKIEDLRFEITNKINDASGVIDDCNNRIVSFKKPKASRKFDLEKFKQENPDIYKNYLTEKENTRKLIIKE